MSRSKAELARTPERAASPALEMSGVVLRYGERTALDGLDLVLPEGTWTGLIGPNGAGKTTAMLVIAGLLPTHGGRVALFGRSAAGRPSPDIGWVPQEIGLYPQLTARENLTAFGRLHRVPRRDLEDRVAWALGWTGLEERADERIASFSGGMRRRVNIACAVLHRPRLLLLDEPTVGVDPQARERIFGMLRSLRDEGLTLLHSSHELDDVEDVCDRLVVLDGGRAVASGTSDELVRGLGGEGATVSIELEGVEGPLPGLEHDERGRWIARVSEPAVDLPVLLESIRRRGGRITGLELRRPGLREVFLGLTGRELRE